MADMFGQMETGARYSALPASPEEQQIMSRAQMQQVLANALLQRGMTPINPMRSSGRYVVPISPLEGISQLGTALLGARALKSSIEDPMQQLMAVRSRNNNLLSSAAMNLAGGPTPSPSAAPQPSAQPALPASVSQEAPQSPSDGSIMPLSRTLPNPAIQSALDSGESALVRGNGTNTLVPTRAPQTAVQAPPQAPAQAPQGMGYLTPSQVIAAASRVAGASGWQLGTVLNSPEFGPFFHQAIRNMAPTDLMKEMASAGYGPGTPEFNQAMLWKGLPPSDVGKLISEWKRTQAGTPENQLTLDAIQRHNYIAPENFPPGAMRVDPHTGEVTFAPDANTGMRLVADPSVPSGVRAVKIGGSAEIQADRAGAIRGAESRNTVYPNQTVGGVEGVPIWGSDIPQGGASPGSPRGNGGKSTFGISPTDKTYKGALGTDMAEYEKNLNAKVDAGYELVRRVNEQEQLLKDFRTGATGPVRERIAAYARDFPIPVPEWIVKGLGAGDPAAAQEFEKFAAQTNLEQLKQAIGQNRMLKTEFDSFQRANPNIGTDPKAVAKVFQWLRQAYANDIAQQQALQEFKGTNQPIDRFPAWYAKRRDELLRQNRNPGAAIPGPSQNQSAGPPARVTSDTQYQQLPSGATYVAPDGSTRRKK